MPRNALIPAAYVYPLSGQQVLLQQRRDTGYMDGCWVAAAAGHIELHETAAGCIVREATEELGITIEPEDLEPLTVMQRTNGTAEPNEQRVDWFYTVRRWRGEPTVMEPAKCAHLTWFDLDALPQQIPVYERRVLDGVRTGILPIFLDDGFASRPGAD